jgi:putative inorganic carbon (HCO3(-)) transporter
MVLTSLRKRAGQLLRLEPFWLLLMGPLILFPGRWLLLAWQPWVVFALFAFPLLRLALDWGRLALHSPVTLPIVLMLLWLPVNIWAAPDRPLAWVAAGYLLFGVAWYGALVRWPPARRQPAWIAGFLLLAVCGLALVAPPLVNWKTEFRLFHLPIYDWFDAIHLDLGETIHANILAAALVLVLPLLLALLLYPWQEFITLPGQTGRQSPAGQGRLLTLGLRLLLGLSFVYVTGLLILTQSRGAALATVFILPLTLLLRWPRLWRLAPLAVALGAVAVWWLGPSVIAEELSKEGSLGGWQGRLDVWNFSLMALQDFVFTGVGIGSFTITLPLLYPLPFDVTGFPHAHNLFLQVGLDLGLPGLIAYLAILINLFVMAIGLLRRSQLSPLQRSLTIGATAALVGFLIHGLVDAAAWGVKLAFLPWLLFALITALYLDENNTPEPNHKTPIG